MFSSISATLKWGKVEAGEQVFTCKSPIILIQKIQPFQATNKEQEQQVSAAVISSFTINNSYNSV